MDLEIRGSGLDKIALKNGERYTGEHIISKGNSEYYKDGKIIRKCYVLRFSCYEYEKEREKTSHIYKSSDRKYLYFDIKEEFGELHGVSLVDAQLSDDHELKGNHFFNKLLEIIQFFKNEIKKDKFIFEIKDKNGDFYCFNYYKFKEKMLYIKFKIPFYYGEIDGEMEIYTNDSILLAKFIFKNGNLIEKIYY
ncbi:MAG: hypothetical protein SOY60_05935 [Fusobacterium gastrosuis]|uniref:hypothetical protein n=1 Tax=Fusobacterium gastrosuis TaxID=1755100 RepID=UPI002A897069|nr:hypothetical protein [Fusobacterium gastrosuis]